MPRLCIWCKRERPRDGGFKTMGVDAGTTWVCWWCYEASQRRTKLKTVQVCGAAAKIIPQLIDRINGPAGEPKAVTVGDTIFVFTSEAPSPQLIRHEQEHVAQAERMSPRWLRWWPWLATRMGWARFWVAYGDEHRRVGYWDNKFEHEARVASGEEAAA
jgi:hypothetical protein